MKTQTAEMLARLQRLGISFDDAMALRRISMTLHRWAELECGDGNDWASWGIERDETSGVPYMVTRPHASNEARRTKIPDRETGALLRLHQIMERYPELAFYHQTDPRGAALYILRRDDVPADAELESCYTRGVAVYK